jgi:amphi-Trp domain-containing protein
MTERDVERSVDKAYFVETLRRLADSIEKGETFRIQVAGTRFAVPGDAELRIEHEIESGVEELALELSWSTGGAR